MNLKHLFYSILILLFRLLDLFTTDIATVVDFSKQEQNFLVKDFGLSKSTFFISEIIFAFILIIIYLKSVKYTYIFKIKSHSFSNYLYFFFFQEKEFNLLKVFSLFSFKRTFLLYGMIIPKLYITTSLIFSLNNYWVYLFHKDIKNAVTLYMFFDKAYIIDFIIFYLPLIIFLIFMFQKLKIEYNKGNDTKWKKEIIYCAK